MLHRRLLKDDGRGVGEPLNETTIMASKEWYIYKIVVLMSFLTFIRLIFSNQSSAASLYRPLAKKAYHPFVLAFGPNIPVATWYESQSFS